MTTPKRILIAAIHYPVASGRYIARAFERMGHDVRTVGPNTGDRIWGMTVDKRHIWRSGFDTRTRPAPGSPDLESLIETWQLVKQDGWSPDLVVCADSGFTVSNADRYPRIVWGVDNHVRSYEHCEGYDHYFLAHHDGPALPVDESRRDMTWLPCAYDPEYFTPSPIPMAEREYDVCMIGVAYPRRVEIIEAMQAAGLKVFAATGLLYEDYARAYQNSRISLCVSAAGDVAQRVFETAAMGCAILSDQCWDFGRLGFYTAGAGILFGDTDHAVENATKMLDGTLVTSALPLNVATLESLEANAIAWAKSGTWDARAQVVLDTMFGKSDPPSKLDKMIEKARAEDERGETEPLEKLLDETQEDNDNAT